MIQEIKQSYQDHCYVCGKLIEWPTEGVEAELPEDSGRRLVCKWHTYGEVAAEYEKRKRE